MTDPEPDPDPDLTIPPARFRTVDITDAKELATEDSNTTIPPLASPDKKSKSESAPLSRPPQNQQAPKKPDLHSQGLIPPHGPAPRLQPPNSVAAQRGNAGTPRAFYSMTFYSMLWPLCWRIALGITCIVISGWILFK